MAQQQQNIDTRFTMPFPQSFVPLVSSEIPSQKQMLPKVILPSNMTAGATQRAQRKRKKPSTLSADSLANAGLSTKRSKLLNMVFYEAGKYPAATIHELRPDITPDKYIFQEEELITNNRKHKRYHCKLQIDQIQAIGIGKSKQIAKNMAAQQALIQLYPTYRPPTEAILSELSSNVQSGSGSIYGDTLSTTSGSDPQEQYRKYLTTTSIALKTPVQLFNELFRMSGKINLIKNDENIFIVKVQAFDQTFFGLSSSKIIAQNEACQLAIETLCNVSFRDAKTEFFHGLQKLNKLNLNDDEHETMIREDETT